MTDYRIDKIEPDEDEFFVWLKRGYRLDDAHCFGERNLKDIRNTMKRVKVCTCKECINL